MGHLAQIMVLVVVVALIAHSIPVFFIGLGVEIVSIWRHELQHHPNNFFARRVWFFIGTLVAIFAAFTLR